VPPGPGHVAPVGLGPAHCWLGSLWAVLPVGVAQVGCPWRESDRPRPLRPGRGGHAWGPPWSWSPGAVAPQRHVPRQASPDTSSVRVGCQPGSDPPLLRPASRRPCMAPPAGPEALRPPETNARLCRARGVPVRAAGGVRYTPAPYGPMLARRWAAPGWARRPPRATADGPAPHGPGRGHAYRVGATRL
jgi:hypothetical protein